MRSYIYKRNPSFSVACLPTVITNANVKAAIMVAVETHMVIVIAVEILMVIEIEAGTLMVIVIAVIRMAIEAAEVLRQQKEAEAGQPFKGPIRANPGLGAKSKFLFKVFPKTCANPN